MLKENDVLSSFIKIESKKTIENTIKKFFSSTVKSSMWVKNQKEVYNINFTNEYGSFLYLLLASRSNKIILKKLLSKIVRSCCFKISLPDEFIFFSMEFNNLKRNNTMVFEKPNVIYKIQRRSEIRLVISDIENIEAKLIFKIKSKEGEDEEVETVSRIIDISAQGISCNLDRSLKQKVKKETELKLIQFKIPDENKTFNLKGIVRRVVDVKNNNEYFNIGIQFSDIRDGEAQIISHYIFDRNRKKISNIF